MREILEIQLADTVKARRILPRRPLRAIRRRRRPPVRSQERLYEALAANGIFR